MVVCIDKVTCVRMHDLIARYWKERLARLQAGLSVAMDAEEFSRPQAADRLDGGDPHGGGGERGAGRDGEVPQMGSGHHSSPQAPQGRDGTARRNARQATVPQQAANGAGRGLQGRGTPLSHRHCLRHVADRLRCAEPGHPLPGQTPQSPHPDAGHRPRQPGQRRQKQRTGGGLLRHPQAPAPGAGHLRRDSTRRRQRRQRRRIRSRRPGR